MPSVWFRPLLVPWLLAAALSSAARGEEPNSSAAQAAVPTDWKLTYTHHFTEAEPDGRDLNVRGTHGPTVFWLGQYWRASEFEQTRAGVEQTLSFDWGKAVIGGQAATHGFLGGAAQAEIGKERVRLIAGLGRTNLKPYYNLNFDPNDAITLGAVADLPEGMRATFFAIHDDRLGTGQTVVHAILRTSNDAPHRWTVDVAQRRGPLGDGGPRVNRTGVAVTYDQAPWFGRIVTDPNANFSGHDMIRVALGARF